MRQPTLTKQVISGDLPGLLSGYPQGIRPVRSRTITRQLILAGLMCAFLAGCAGGEGKPLQLQKIQKLAAREASRFSRGTSNAARTPRRAVSVNSDR